MKSVQGIFVGVFLSGPIEKRGCVQGQGASVVQVGESTKRESDAR
jgi:hypothetical protein